MLDEDLMVRANALEDERRRQCATVDVRPWEEEVAYVRREQQIRRVRRELHSEWMRRGDEEFNKREATLPAGDFDNSAFVYAATGGRPRWN
jgi:hypothetical protein